MEYVQVATSEVVEQMSIFSRKNVKSNFGKMINGKKEKIRCCKQNGAFFRAPSNYINIDCFFLFLRIFSAVNVSFAVVALVVYYSICTIL